MRLKTSAIYTGINTYPKHRGVRMMDDINPLDVTVAKVSEINQ